MAVGDLEKMTKEELVDLIDKMKRDGKAQQKGEQINKVRNYRHQLQGASISRKVWLSLY